MSDDFCSQTVANTRTASQKLWWLKQWLLCSLVNDLKKAKKMELWVLRFLKSKSAYNNCLFTFVRNYGSIQKMVTSTTNWSTWEENKKSVNRSIPPFWMYPTFKIFQWMLSSRTTMFHRMKWSNYSLKCNLLSWIKTTFHYSKTSYQKRSNTVRKYQQIMTATFKSISRIFSLIQNWYSMLNVIELLHMFGTGFLFSF